MAYATPAQTVNREAKGRQNEATRFLLIPVPGTSATPWQATCAVPEDASSPQSSQSNTAGGRFAYRLFYSTTNWGSSAEPCVDLLFFFSKVNEESFKLFIY